MLIREQNKIQTERKYTMIPRLSHLQFAVLSVVGNEIMLGAQIRHKLSSLGVHLKGPSFYQMMGRIEKAGLLLGKYQIEVTNGQMIRQRVYSLSSSGREAVKESFSFYGRDNRT